MDIVPAVFIIFLEQLFCSVAAFMLGCRGVFLTLVNVYDRISLQKQLTAKSC